MKGHLNISSNNLSNDNSTWFVNEVVGSEDSSVELDVFNVDGSSSSNNVVGNSGSGSRERSSSEGNISSSNDVDKPSSVVIASRDRDPGVLSHLSRSKRDVVIEGVLVLASQVESGPLDRDTDVISVRANRGLELSVASLSSGERRGNVALASRVSVARGSEGR